MDSYRYHGLGMDIYNDHWPLFLIVLDFSSVQVCILYFLQNKHFFYHHPVTLEKSRVQIIFQISVLLIQNLYLVPQYVVLELVFVQQLAVILMTLDIEVQLTLMNLHHGNQMGGVLAVAGSKVLFILVLDILKYSQRILDIYVWVLE